MGWRQGTVAGKGGLGVRGLFLCPPAEPMHIHTQVPGRFRHTIALLRNQADCLPFKLCRRGLAFLCHAWTPPGVIIPRFSRCPFLVDHNRLDEVKASLEQAMTVLAVLVDDLSPALGRNCAPHSSTPCANHSGAVSRDWSLSKRRWMPWPRKVKAWARSISWSASSACP